MIADYSLMLFATLAAAAALAVEPEPEPECKSAMAGQPPPVSASPDWLVKPRFQDIYWAFPRRAVSERVTGRAIIKCGVTVQGAAHDCVVIEEDPKGYGFGEAAVSLSAKMLFRPKVVCGVVAPGTVRIPIAFAFPQASPSMSVEPLDPADKKLALAARLLAAMGVRDFMRDGVDLDTLGFMDFIEEDEGDLTAEERMALHDSAREAWSAGEGKVMNALARAMAKRLTEEELVQAVAFYESPVGKKMGSADDQLMLDMQALYGSIMPDMWMDFRRRYCERVQSSCAPEDAI